MPRLSFVPVYLGLYKVGQFITTVPCLYEQKYDGKPAEEVYDDLMKNVQKISIEDLTESAKNIQYWVYDWIVQKTFSDRNSDITTYIVNNNVVRRVPTHLVDTITHLNELYEKYIDEGYEGQMVRTDGPYENKRSKYLLKRKEFQDSEFKILDIVEGIGNKSGMAGYMVFKNHKGIEFHSNIKGTREYLKELLKNKNIKRSTDKTVLPPKFGGSDSTTTIPLSFSKSSLWFSP